MGFPRHPSSSKMISHKKITHTWLSFLPLPRVSSDLKFPVSSLLETIHEIKQKEDFVNIVQSTGKKNDVNHTHLSNYLMQCIDAMY